MKRRRSSVGDPGKATILGPVYPPAVLLCHIGAVLLAIDLCILHDWRPAMITRFIGEASGEQEIYLLLAAYVEATGLHAKVSGHSRRATNTSQAALTLSRSG